MRVLGDCSRKSSNRGFTALVLTASLSLAACGPKAGPKNWTNAAPTSAKEAGYIVQAEQKDVERVIASHEGVARVLHAASGLFEVRGVDRDTLRRELSGAYIAKNLYFDNLIKEMPEPGTPVVPNAPESQPTPTRPVPAPAQPATPATPAAPLPPHQFKLDQCKFTHTGPTAVVKAVRLQEQLKKHPIVNLTDAEFEFSSEGSLAGGAAAESTMLLWKIMAPENSKFSEAEVPGPTLKFKADMPGGYQVVLITQDRNYRCDYESVSFGVTVNAEFKGAKKPRSFEPQDRDEFKHLAVIHAESAWAKTRGEGVTIAVIDSGVNYNHPDLSSNIAINTKEIVGNGIDDDGNGRIDDVLGWDFAEGDNMPLDDNEHGTHVAGLAASAVTGVAPKAKILAVKALNAMGGGDTASIVGGILYAVDRGAQVINASFGSYSTKMAESLKPALEYADKHGVLFVAASGNGHPVFGTGMDTDVTPHFPSSMSPTYSTILAVAATDLTGELTSYSNFGLKSVQIAAPGGSDVDGPLTAAYYVPEVKAYTRMSGTSMATPVTAGVAALVKSLHPELKATEVKDLILKSAKPLDKLKGKTSVGGLVDAAEATK